MPYNYIYSAVPHRTVTVTVSVQPTMCSIYINLRYGILFISSHLISYHLNDLMTMTVAG
jgi:hypothetical protein